jgi:hypothetical protein
VVSPPRRDPARQRQLWFPDRGPAWRFYGKGLRRVGGVRAVDTYMISGPAPGLLAGLTPNLFRASSADYDVNMEQHVEQLPQASPPLETTSPDGPGRNRGWFRPGDRRINREGRPRGSKAGSHEGSAPADRAPCADRFMLLVLPARDLAWRLTKQNAPWIVNLPADFEIVGSRADAARGAVVLVIRSQTFPRIAKGAVIPRFNPELYGLRWRRG